MTVGDRIEETFDEGAYPKAMLSTWGKVPEYGGRGAPPTLPKPGKDWQFQKAHEKTERREMRKCTHESHLWRSRRSKSEMRVPYGDCPKEPAFSSRTMNGRLVRKTLSFSKELRFLEASPILEDAIYNFTRPVKTLRVELPNSRNLACWQQRSPAMAAGLTSHIWTVKELLTVVLVPLCANT